jgi:hypothetical protein
MQSVFSLASQQRSCDVNKGFTGDAELKTDWTKPPTAFNAMGFDSFFSIHDECITQLKDVHGDVSVRSRRVKARLRQRDRYQTATQNRSQRCRDTARHLRTTRSEVEGGDLLKLKDSHDVFRISGGEAGRLIRSTVTI